MLADLVVAARRCEVRRIVWGELGVAVFAEDLAHLVDRQHGGAGGFDFDAGDVDADADFQVGSQKRAAFGRHFKLYIVKDRFGAARGGDGGGGLESGLELFAVEGDFHGTMLA